MNSTPRELFVPTANCQDNFPITGTNDIPHFDPKDDSAVHKFSDQETVFVHNICPDLSSTIMEIQGLKLVTPSTETNQITANKSRQ